MSDVAVRRSRKVDHVDGCQKLRTCGCPFEYEEGWRYDIRFTWPSGSPYREKRRIPISDFTEKKALVWAKERLRKILADGEQTFAVPKEEVKIPTIAEFKDAYLRHKAGQRLKASTEYATACVLRKHIIPVLGKKRLDEIGIAAIDELKESMEELSDKTINNVLATLGNMVRVAKEMKLIRELPIEKFGLLKIDNSKPPPFYTEEEYGRLVEAALQIDPRVAVAVLLGGDAGLRCGEILALPPFCVRWQLKYVEIDRQVWRTIVDSPKSGKGRQVPMTDRLAFALRLLGRVTGDRVLLRDDGQPFTVKQLRAVVAEAQAHAGLEATGNIHILRHSFCTHLAMRGAPATTIQALAGHAHLSTTMRYMHVVKGAKEAAIALLNAPLPRGLAPEEHSGFGRILAAE